MSSVCKAPLVLTFVEQPCIRVGGRYRDNLGIRSSIAINIIVIISEWFLAVSFTVCIYLISKLLIISPGGLRYRFLAMLFKVRACFDMRGINEYHLRR